MFEIILASCLAGDPTDCGTGRLKVEGDLSACRSHARAIVEQVPNHIQLQSYACVAAGAEPEAAVSEISPNMFVHRGKAWIEGQPGTNSVFIIGTDAVAVVDPGAHPLVGSGLLRAIRAETDLPIRWIVLTHSASANVLGTGPLLEDGGSVIGHARTEGLMAAGVSERIAALRGQGMTDLLESDLVLPDDGVQGTREIELGNRRLVLTAHRAGRSGADLSVFDPSSKTLVLGGLLTSGDAPLLKAPLDGWLDTLAELRETDAQRAVPGHGPVELEWPASVDRLSAYLSALAEGRQAVSDGQDPESVFGRIAEAHEKNWRSFDTAHRANVALILGSDGAD